MVEASVEITTSPNGSGRGGRMAGGVLRPAYRPGCGDDQVRDHQSLDEAAVSIDPNPHGVESDPKASKGNLLEPENLIVAPQGVAEATGDRDDEGRSPRSSPRAGKPSTWRRGTVGKACTQEGAAWPYR